MVSWEFFIYTIMSSVKSNSVTCYFPIQIPIISFSCLTALARTSKTMLNKSGKINKSLSCSWFQKKCFQLFTTEDDAGYGFATDGLNYVEVCSLYTHFVQSFYHKWMLNFVKSSFCICWDGHMIFILQFAEFYLQWCITLIDLQIFSHPCYTGINPTWLWCMILLMYCWIQIANILLRIFASMFISGVLCCA